MTQRLEFIFITEILPIVETERLFYDGEEYRTIAQVGSPFGDGRSAERIVTTLLTRQ